jgi:hypothetical protein
MNRIAPRSANGRAGAGDDRRPCRADRCRSGYTGEAAAEAAEQHGIELEVVKHTQAKRGFALLPRRCGGKKFCLGSTIPASGPRLRQGSCRPSRRPRAIFALKPAVWVRRGIRDIVLLFSTISMALREQSFPLIPLSESPQPAQHRGQKTGFSLAIRNRRPGSPQPIYPVIQEALKCVFE